MTDRSFDDALVDEHEQAHLAAGIGRDLRRLRMAAGLTQEALAEQAGAGRRTVQRLECGQRRPRMSLLGALAEVLDPDDAPALAERLAAAAGSSLAADTRRSTHRRMHLARRARARRDDPAA